MTLEDLHKENLTNIIHVLLLTKLICRPKEDNNKIQVSIRWIMSYLLWNFYEFKL